MGTRWRGLLAPIDKPTGDGRRMKAGAFTHRELPLALKWQRTDDQGHDASVVVGLMDTLTIDDKAGEVWGEGELFDDQPNLPRLSEDVAEAMLLTSKKIIGPSVDAGAAEVVFVEQGHDEPLTDQRWEELMTEADQTGEEPKIEMLFTKYEIAAATLVVIPAFAEARPFELLAPDKAEEPVPVAAALVASITASAGVAAPPADVFDRLPEAGELHRIQVEDRGEGFLRVFGYAAQFGTCHVGFKDVCRTPPQSETGYVPFHRYAVDVDGGWVAAGRLTHGFGRTGCECGACAFNDDHACGTFTLAEAVAHHDRMATIAYVRATDTDDGVWVAGYAPTNLEPAARAALGRQKFSGDWREHGGQLELVEVLALAREREGFPITPTVGMRNGRQLSLTAAGVVRPDQAVKPAPLVDMNALADAVAERVAAKLRPGAPLAITAATAEHTGAMVALVPSEKDAKRLAVDGGEPADELHATRAYLGEAADWSDEHQAALKAAMEGVAGGMAPIEADGFALSMFNPNGDDPCVVLGLGGAPIAQAQEAVMAALEPFAGLIPAQHAPKVEHLTLQFTDDPGQVAALVDRAGPVTFDRLRVVFAGKATDYPLTGKASSPEADTAASLIHAVELAVGDVDPANLDRAATAAGLLTELESADV